MITRPRLLRYAGPAFGLAVFVVALVVLGREVRGERFRDILRHVDAIPPGQLIAAVLLTVLSFAILTGYDAVSVRYVRAQLPFRRIALASFLNYSFSQGLGFPLLTGGSVRYRLYSGWGLSGLRITNIIAFASLSFWLGVLLVGGVVFLHGSPAIASLLHLPQGATRPIGGSALLLVTAYVVWTRWGRRVVRVGEWRFRRPSAREAFSQLAVGAADWAVVSSVLYVLLPAEARVAYPAFVGIFLLAFVAGIISNVPGGLGVFETVIVLLLPEAAPQSAVLGALLAYRGVYYLLPLATAAIVLGAYEIARRLEVLQRATRPASLWEPLLAPNVLAAVAFGAGLVLLISSAIPIPVGRFAPVAAHTHPLVPEIAHLLGALCGLGLLVLTPAMQRHVAGAFRWSVALIAVGIVSLMAEGLQYEEAVLLAAALALLLTARRHFFREASPLGASISPAWGAAILLALVGTLWIGGFTFRFFDASLASWTATGAGADGARFLRAAVALMIGALATGIAHAARRAPPPPPHPGEEELARIRPIIAAARDTIANLALVGDKELVISARGDAFLMFAIERRSWVVLGDPVGPRARWTELVWRLREMAEREGGWPAFYLVSRQELPLYVDLGLTLLKVGEEARVPLERFAGGSGHRARVLRARSEAGDSGLRMTIHAQKADAPVAELLNVDAAWRKARGRGEKRFAAGVVSEAYIRELPVAVLRHGERIVAFAILWLGADRVEMAADIVRHDPVASDGDVMNHLLVELMLWGREQGYQHFSLGTAPLAGLEPHTLSSLWSRVGALPFRHGEHFGNAQALRAFKESFDPQWEPRYLATPPGLALPRTLSDIAALITGLRQEPRTTR